MGNLWLKEYKVKGNLPYGNILLNEELSPKSAELFFEAKLTNRYLRHQRSHCYAAISYLLQ
jgi:hypothetical protein